jgi:hypothetical protein
LHKKASFSLLICLIVLSFGYGIGAQKRTTLIQSAPAYFTTSMDNTQGIPSLSVSVETSNTTIIADNSFTLHIVLTNQGASAAEDVVVSIELPFGLTSTSTRQNLGTIYGCGSGVTCGAVASFTILTGEPGTYSLKVLVSAKNTETYSDSISISVVPTLPASSNEANNVIPGFTVVFVLLGLSTMPYLSRLRKNT